MKARLIRSHAPAVIALASSLLLAACGGGGGGGTSSDQTVTTVSLSGVAAKGILKAAQATAYEYKNGAWVEIKKVTTGSDGSYSFTGLPSTTNPVKVEVSVVSGTTKMLDESQVENDAYKEVDAPAGLTIRTMVDKLDGDRADINANPFTEMAVEAALTAKDENGATLPPSATTWAAAKSQIMTLLPAGVTPESIKPLAPSDTPTAAQASIMTLLTGLAASQDIVAAINEMKSAFALEIKADGTAVVPQANQSAVQAKFASLNTAGVTKLTVLATANPNLKFSSFKDETTDYNAKTFVSKNLAVEEARNSLASFIETMRVGLEAVDGKVTKATQDFDDRVTPLVFDLAGTAINGTSLALEEVELDTDANGYIILTQFCGQTCRFSLTKISDGSYNFEPKSPESVSGSSSITGRVGPDNSLSLSFEGSAKSATTNKTIASFSLSFSTTDVERLDLGNGTISINSLTATAFDDSGAKSATLAITDGKLTASNNGNSGVLEGTIALSTSMGDELKGTFSGSQISVQNLYGYYEDVPLSLKASLTGKLANVSIASISIEASNTTTKDNYFSDDKQTGVVSLAITFPGAKSGSDVKVSVKDTTTLEKHSISGTISSAGNSFTFEEADIDGPTDVPLVLTSSSGEFKVTLDDNDNGELSKGSTKIGDIKRGVLSYDGVQQSLF